SIIFKVVKYPLKYIEIRKYLRAQESSLYTIQTLSIQDRTINYHFSMFIDAVGIDRDHSIIDNKNGIVTLNHRDEEIWLNGKFLSTPFLLQHGTLVCFRRNSTFHYCDQQFVHKTMKKKQI
ncbi:unnamed protein product, partial [Rotaria sp. Silwood2]